MSNDVPTVRFFLLVGSTSSEAVISRLKASRTPYVEKRLQSSPENWSKIAELIRSPEHLATIIKLTGRNIQLAAGPRHQAAAEDIVEALGLARHLVLVHESLLAPERESDLEDEEEEWDYPSRFVRPPEPTLAKWFALLARHGVNVVPYRTNADLSVIAATFVEDNEQNLLFRVYVPSGRLYADETDRLVSVFHDWLTRVKGVRVRRDGYETSQGQVFEFFGEDLSRDQLAAQFDDFSRFLDLCVRDVDEATRHLTDLGLDGAGAAALVTRYARDSRRLHRDMRRARDELVVRLRYELEEELDEGDSQHDSNSQLDTALRQLIPEPGASSGLRPAPPQLGIGARDVIYNITNQYIDKLDATVTANVVGTVNLGPETRQLVELVEKFGAEDREDLRTAAFELEDADAPSNRRLLARQRLTRFLLGLGGKVEDTALKVAQKYVENKLNLP